jgi:RimJ/RimL family protein N-acetyltransferase
MTTEQAAITEPPHTTKDHRSFRVRQARKQDAAAMLRYAEALFAEPGLSLLYSPGEFSKTLAEEEEFIESYSRPNALILLAVAGDEVIGSLAFRAGTLARTGHDGTFGVAVAQHWRGVGVGSVLIERMITWAKGHREIERIGMEVFETNPGALRLYRRFGFQEEGRRRAAVRLDDRRVDAIQMALVFPQKGQDASTP